MFYFGNFIFQVKEVEAQNIQTRHQQIQERQDMLNKTHPLSRYKANSGENKNKCLMHFEPEFRVFVLSN